MNHICLQVVAALPTPVSKTLPADVMETAARVLGPQAGLPDKARYSRLLLFAVSQM